MEHQLDERMSSAPWKMDASLMQISNADDDQSRSTMIFEEIEEIIWVLSLLFFDYT